MGEVAALIIFVQFVSGFGFECQGGARKRAAGSRLRNFDITRLIIDGVCDQRIAAPLGIEVQILYNRHGEIKRLFNAVFFIEPANERVVAVGRVSGLGSKTAVRNFLHVAIANVDNILHVSSQPRCDRVGLWRPLGVKHNVTCGHLCGVPLYLGTVEAALGGIPSGELISVCFKASRISRRKGFTLQRCFILNVLFFIRYKAIVVEELQLVAVTGVVKVVILLHLYFPVFREIRVGFTLREAGNGMKFLSVSQTGTFAVIEVDHFVLFIVPAFICGIASCSIYRFYIVVNLCARLGIVFCKRDVLAGHSVNTAEICLFS